MSGKIWATNNLIELQFESEDEIPSGWIPHKRLQRSLESRQKQSITMQGHPGYWQDKKMPPDKRGETLRCQFKDGSRTPWNRGLKNDPRCKGPKKGTSPWNKGLTATSDERVLKNIKGWLDGSCQLKSYETKKRNQSFKNHNTKAEQVILQYLKSSYKEEDIISQYRDEERYPFNCDFYIKSEDLFVEVNAFWHHGPHPFNSNSPEDIALLNRWKEKTSSNNQFNEAIKTWTHRDVMKLSYAERYNLNYKTFYSKEVQRLSKELSERNIQYNNRVE